ncbi:hypothetical protein JOC34_003077 [Virgibacillus halotolerans]|uniref:hypothetical protein n=1 Tax=Virgibacillus halotolerans TaxID=1071053 RepID=UPI001960D5D8|nr:hypothetical protein [Virgibacillus halotolerans]MBM7600666.1 hypothetical protein [Virgibacillus halotolerans]
MSHYEAFLEEKLKIDNLFKRGYTITSVQGTLDGDVVEFEHKTLKPGKETILFTNPDSRKYFATLYIKQRQKEEEVK